MIFKNRIYHSLVIYGNHLAYHYVLSHEGAEIGQWWYYVDAHTGKLLFRYDNIQRACPTARECPKAMYTSSVRSSCL